MLCRWLKTKHPILALSVVLMGLAVGGCVGYTALITASASAPITSTAALAEARATTRTEKSYNVSTRHDKKWRRCGATSPQRTFPHASRGNLSPCFSRAGALWAYVHIWKSGGTTIQDMCLDAKRRCRENQAAENQAAFVFGRVPQQLMGKECSNRHSSQKSCTMSDAAGRKRLPLSCMTSLGARVFSFVRDPVDHFLSGLKECVHRKQFPLKVVEARNISSDRLVLAWLHHVQQPARQRTLDHGCGRHSATQVRFLPPPEQVSFLGDMADMKQFFIEQDIPWNHGKINMRHYVDKQRFVSLRDELSTKTISAICQHVRNDYCFFDFEPPPVCRTEVAEYCTQLCI